MHTVINVDEMVPKMVWFTGAATNDHYLLDKLKFDANTIYVFDKGYNDYLAFKRFCDNEKGFVTRIKDNAVYGIEELYIEKCIHSGVLEDQIIELLPFKVINIYIPIPSVVLLQNKYFSFCLCLCRVKL